MLKIEGELSTDELAQRREKRLEAQPFPSIPDRYYYSRHDVETLLYACELIPPDAVASIIEDLNWDFGPQSA